MHSSAAIQIAPPQQVGRYTICDQLAAGGMATVHLARLVGSAGFSRVVAAKRMHRQFLEDPDFKKMFLAEAQLAARIQHPNVVPILDVLTHDDELVIFMEYVHGEALHALMRAAIASSSRIPLPIGCAIIAGALQGLHAAHEARSELGAPLGIVHRDVSPQNILVGIDGVSRVLDFGIAKAMSEQTHTDPGTLKGKFAYMAPEVLQCEPITHQTDIYSAGVVLWELLTAQRLFGGGNEPDRLRGRISGQCPSPRKLNPEVPLALEQVVGRALQVDPANRFSSALEFAIALESAVPCAPQHLLGAWVRQAAAGKLEERRLWIHKIENAVAQVAVRPSVPPLKSGMVPSRPEPTRLTALTALASPSAKRRYNKRFVVLAGVGLALASLVAILLAVRSNHPSTDSRTGTATLPESTGQTHRVEPSTPVSPPTTPQTKAAETNPVALATAATPSSERPTGAHPPSPARSRAPSKKPTKTRTAPRPYLPSGL